MATELHNEIKPDEQLGVSDPLNSNADATQQQTQTPPSDPFSTLLSQEVIVQNGLMRSGNFVTNSAGWRIQASGNAEFNDGTFRGTLTAAAINIPDTTTANSFHVNTDGDAWWGATALASGVAWVKKDGSAKFTSGTIGGWTIGATTLVGGNITLDQANDKITVGASSGIIINGADGTITSNDGVTWKMDGDGTLTGFNEFALNTVENIATYFTSVMPILKNPDTAYNLVGWTLSGANGTVTDGFSSLISSNGDTKFVTNLPGTGTEDNYTAAGSKLLKIKFFASFEPTGASDVVSVGLANTAATLTLDETNIGASVRFTAVDSTGNLWAVNGNGTANTSTEITGVNLLQWHIFEIVFDPGVNAKFYVDGVLKATHSTNLPTGYLSLGIGTYDFNGTGAARINLCPIHISKEI